MPRGSSRVKISAEQKVIIESEPSRRLLVNAGPGTGKTETACRRVAWLINNSNLQANKILVISFTRSAVAEIRARIAANLNDAVNADDLLVTTIDSFAWKLRAGFSRSTDRVSYAESIDLANLEIASNSELQQYLSELQHVIIDEAQDIVGARCDNTSALIQVLSPSCGVSVFADDAQAIYGFADDYIEESGESYTLPDLIREHLTFIELELTEIHRTKDPKLIELFRGGRAISQSGDKGPRKFSTMRQLIASIAHETTSELPVRWDKPLLAAEDSFILFRRRGEALAAANSMKDAPRRVRLRGQAPAVHSWIAVCLFDFTERLLSKDEFIARYQTRVTATQSSSDAAWALLLRHAGTSATVVSMNQLTRQLSQVNPHSDFAPTSIGFGGPIFATIHSAKGREADEVNLCLYTSHIADLQLPTQVEEEARVLFVGATRAKKNLKVSILDSDSFAGTQKSGRAISQQYSRVHRTHYVQIELGLLGDFTPEGQVGIRFWDSAQAALKSQLALSNLRDTVFDFHLKRKQLNLGYFYCFETGESSKDESLPLGFLAESFNNDLHQACHYNATPGEIKYGKSSGSYTLALDPEDDTRSLLHEPWASSGLLLAPSVSEYLKAFYKKRN